MKIGVIGVGVVGSAVKYGIEKLGYSVKTHDKKNNSSSIKDILYTDVCFICVPTPSQKGGNCDTSIVASVVADLSFLKYAGIVAIKSTVEPGTTQKLQEEHPNLTLCFVPEFLRERCALSDFTDNHDICVIGTDSDIVFNKIKKCHGKYPDKFIKVSPTEAEFCKYFINTYNATLITFANSFYEICRKMDVNYSNIKNAMINKSHINDAYLECNENFRGFGGVCLPKDLNALNHLAKKMNTEVDFFEFVKKENSKYKVTVMPGMRKE